MLWSSFAGPARAGDYEPTSSYCRQLAASFERILVNYTPRALAMSQDGEHCGLCVRVMPCKKIAEGVEAGALFECEDRAVRYGAPPPNCKIVACAGC